MTKQENKEGLDQKKKNQVLLLLCAVIIVLLITIVALLLKGHSDTNIELEETVSSPKRNVVVNEENAKEQVKETANNILTNGIETLRDNGVEVYEPTKEELDAWHAAYAEQCMELAKEQIGAEIVDDFVAAVAEYGKE